MRIIVFIITALITAFIGGKIKTLLDALLSR